MKDIKNMNKEECLNFIRETLRFENSVEKSLRDYDWTTNHYRFEMSGYDYCKTGSCVVHNINILNKFAYLGLYDYTEFLYLDFYKGYGIIYLKYWRGDYLEIGESGDLSGMTTSEIIYEIFKLTILSGKNTRRRD